MYEYKYSDETVKSFYLAHEKILNEFTQMLIDIEPQKAVLQAETSSISLNR